MYWLLLYFGLHANVRWFLLFGFVFLRQCVTLLSLLASNWQWSSCLSLWSARITGVQYQNQLKTKLCLLLLFYHLRRWLLSNYTCYRYNPIVLSLAGRASLEHKYFIFLCTQCLKFSGSLTSPTHNMETSVCSFTWEKTFRAVLETFSCIYWNCRMKLQCLSSKCRYYF